WTDRISSRVSVGTPAAICRDSESDGKSSRGSSRRHDEGKQPLRSSTKIRTATMLKPREPRHSDGRVAGWTGEILVDTGMLQWHQKGCCGSVYTFPFGYVPNPGCLSEDGHSGNHTGERVHPEGLSCVSKRGH